MNRGGDEMGWKCLKQVLIMMMIILLTGCGSSREPIKSAVSSALIGVQNYDERTVEKYFGVNILDPNTFLDAKITNDIPFDRMMPQVVERFNFRILDVEDEGDCAIVYTEMTNVDMDKVMALFYIEIFNRLFSNATLYEEGHPNQEELNEAYHQIMTYLIHSEEREMMTTTVEVHLIYEKDSWKIVLDEAVLNGIYGGLLTFFDEDEGV